jgi:hypothetical protein
MNLFLDTNIYLSFYMMSGDDIEELRKRAWPLPSLARSMMDHWSSSGPIR